MTIIQYHRNASADETAAEMDRRGTVIESLEAQVSELRAKLFPYADSPEISGVSWNGMYLIGDKASIKFFHEMKNRGEQIDVYKQAYDQNLAAKDAQIANLMEALKLFVRAEKMARDGNPPQDADRLIEIGDAAIAKAEGRS